MTVKALKEIAKGLKKIGINYELGTWTKKPVYPYFTGEYQENPVTSENGMQETTFLLTGFTRGTWLELEEAKEKIKDYYNKVSGRTVIADDGTAVAIFYDSALIVPTGDAELKRIQINLSIQEWSVK